MRALQVGVVSLVALVSACVVTHGRADRAFNRADYVSAAEQYAVLVESEPGDAGLRARRDEARGRALIAMAARVRVLRGRAQWEPALVALGELLSRRRTWQGVDHPEATSAVVAEVAAATSFLTEQIRRLALEAPLGAEVALSARRQQLDAPELATLWTSLAADVRSAGEARCSRVGAADGVQAYLTRLTVAYCAHFGVGVHAPGPLPDAVAGLSIEGEVSGMTPLQRAQLRATLDELLRQTPWFGDGETRARTVLSGHQAVATSSVAVEQTATWWKSETYQDRESYQEPYQESYLQSYQESYTVQVPYTTYRTETYSCGYGKSASTCSRSFSSTQSRSETRYRTAQRNATRTAYRTAWRTVTRTRSLPQTYRFAATERTGKYSAAWNVGIELGAVPLEVRVALDDRKTGYDHDVSYPAADVKPSRAGLPSLEGWSAKLLEQLRTTFVARLQRHWQTAFCDRPSFDAESAARCAFGATLPPAGRQALLPVFGGDVERVVSDFAPSSAR